MKANRNKFSQAAKWLLFLVIGVFMGLNLLSLIKSYTKPKAKTSSYMIPAGYKGSKLSGPPAPASAFPKSSKVPAGYPGSIYQGPPAPASTFEKSVKKSGGAKSSAVSSKKSSKKSSKTSTNTDVIAEIAQAVNPVQNVYAETPGTAPVGTVNNPVRPSFRHPTAGKNNLIGTVGKTVGGLLGGAGGAYLGSLDYGLTESLSGQQGATPSVLGAATTSIDPNTGQLMTESPNMSYDPSVNNPLTLSAADTQSNLLSNAAGTSGGVLSAGDTTDLQNQLNQLNYQSEGLNTQLSDLENQQNQLLSENEAQQQGLSTQKTALEQQAQEQTQAERDAALTRANQNVAKTRNILRALGILGSSAAGDLLSRPMNEYDQTVATLGQNLVTRFNDINTWYQQQNTKFTQYAEQIKQNYYSQYNNIMSDIRFTDAQKKVALDALNAAAKQALTDANVQNQTAAAEADAARQQAVLDAYAYKYGDQNQTLM